MDTRIYGALDYTLASMISIVGVVEGPKQVPDDKYYTKLLLHSVE